MSEVEGIAGWAVQSRTRSRYWSYVKEDWDEIDKGTVFLDRTDAAVIALAVEGTLVPVQNGSYADKHWPRQLP